MLHVLEFLSIAAMKHHDQKANWGGKGLFNLHFCLMNYIDVKYKRKSGQELKQSRNLEAGADAEVMGGMLLPGLLSLLCYGTSPRIGTSYNGLDLPPLIKKMPYSWILWKHFFS